jgi:hypothetical protein
LFRLVRRSLEPARDRSIPRRFRPLLETLEHRLAPANVDVLSAHNDGFLSGENLGEEILTPANVNATGFGKLFSRSVDGYVYAQPLYKANLTIPGQGVHDVAFVATEHDSVYAFDTDSSAPGPGPDGSLWKTSFLSLANGITSVPSGDVGIVSTNIVPEVGITGTPVIDPSSNTLYVVAKTKEVRSDGAHYVQKLHALDITTGQERFGGPATIGDNGPTGNVSPVSVPGNGDGAVGGTVTFNARMELQRPALQLVNGVVYISWASHEDARPYHGWVVGYNASNLAAGPVRVFNTAPNAGGVGIWESGGSLAADPQGNLYFAVGNGFNGPNPGFDPAHGNYSESVLKLSTTGQLQVADYFTPYDWATLDAQDADLGSGGTMLLPDYVGSATHRHLMVETGKSGKIYLIDRDNMGQNVPPPGPDNVVQTVTAGQTGVWGNPAFFQLNATTGVIYYHGQGDFLKGYLISNGHIDDTPSDILRSTIRAGYPGTQPVVSANGIANPTSPTNGIVWELQVDAGDPSTNPTGAVTLRAFRANDFSTELYDSNQTSFRDQPSPAVKFTVPTVTNGHVLVAAQYGFAVFGLFPQATAVPVAPQGLQGAAQASSRGTQIHLIWNNPSPAVGAAPTGIKVLRSTDGTTFTQIATVSAQTNTFTDPGPFVTGQHYFYRVVATNQMGDSPPSNTADVIAPIPSAVLSIVSVTSSSLGLSWTAVANDHYDIERSTDGVTFSRVGTVQAPQTTYTDTGLTAGAYAYRIHAFNVTPASESLSNVRGGTVGPVIDHGSGFGTTVDLTANGSASFGNNIVRLTGDDLQTGSFFANTPMAIARFTTTFVERLSEGTQPDYADGFTFLIQANAPTALGQGLGGLGSQGILNSVAVKFGSFQYPGDPSNSSTALVLNGAAPRGGVTTGNVLLNSQNPKRITLTYDGTTLAESITDTLTGDSFTTSFTVNIAQVIGSDSAYVGFTGSTGSPGASSFWQLQDIGSWMFTSQAPLPGAPTNLRVTGTAATEIDLAWYGNSANETGFRIERSADNGTTFTPAGTSTTTSFADTGLARGTYYYRVVAYNANGDSGASNVVTATVPPTDPPPVITSVNRSTNLIRPNGTLTLTVNFTDSDANDPHTAVINWGDSSTNTTLPLAGGTVSFNASHQYTGAAVGNYSIRVTVQDDDGGNDSLNLTASSASIPSPSGLTDWYSGDGLSPTTAADLAGTNPGTLMGGVSYLPGKVGNAFSFNGTDGYVKLPDNFFPYPTTGTRNVPFAFAAWFSTTTGGVILGQQGGPAFGTNPNGWVPAVYVGTDGKLWAQMFWVGSVAAVSSAATVNDGQFHFVAISSDGQRESVYLDNQLIGTTSGVEVGYTNSYSYQLGVGFTDGDWRSVPRGWYPFRGLVDEVQFFNTALPPATIGAIFNAGSAGEVKGVTVQEVPPVITTLSRSPTTINENGTLTLNGTFTDPQGGDTHTVVITWGDNSADTTLSLAAGTLTFSANHRYTEEPGSSGYPIRVTVQGSDGGSDTVNLTTGASAVAPPAGLVSWWTGDGTNATTAPDIAGPNPGSLFGGVTYAAGKVGNSFHFDGAATSYVNIPDSASLNVTTGATWDFWAQTTQTGAYVGLVGKHDGVTSYNGVTLWIDPTSGVASVQVKGAMQTLTLQGMTPVNDGQFHHIALTFASGGVTNLYVDGQLQATGTSPVFQFNPNPLRFGSLLDPFWTPLRGALDEVQIFNRVLSAAEIQAIFNAGSAGQVKSVTVLDPAVAATGGFSFNAVAGVPSRLQTVATFTDPAGAEAMGDYTASIAWGDTGMPTNGTITFNAATGVFTVQGSHLYTQAGMPTITVTLHHDSAPDVTVTDTANVGALVIHFVVAGFPSPTVAGVAGSVTVTAQDQFDETVSSYVGTVHFTSSDSRAALPADYPFVAGDMGQHTFSVTLVTAGTQSITATDTAASTITGTQAGISITPAEAGQFAVSGYPTAVSGTVNTFTVTVTDAYGNRVPVYLGTVHFTSSDPNALLPDTDYTFTAADAGAHVFGAVLYTVGAQSITATSTTTPILTGTQQNITITPRRFLVSGFPSPITAGMPGAVEVTAYDALGNVATGYLGTVHFTSSDSRATLPADYTFTPSDAGDHTFPATLVTAGSQSITATDPLTPLRSTGTQSGIQVTPDVAAGLLVSGFPSPVTAGTFGSVVVTAVDAYGNVATGFTGTVHLSSSDTQAVLEGDHTFTSDDAGSYAFSTALLTAGTQSITASSDSLSGSQNGIVVTPAAADHLVVSGYPSPVQVGTSHQFTVQAVDAYGNVDTNYRGTVHLSSNDAAAMLPADYIFGDADLGQHTFDAVMGTVGTWWLDAVDVLTGSIHGRQDGIVVVS